MTVVAEVKLQMLESYANSNVSTPAELFAVTVKVASLVPFAPGSEIVIVGWDPVREGTSASVLLVVELFPNAPSFATTVGVYWLRPQHVIDEFDRTAHAWRWPTARATVPDVPATTSRAFAENPA